MEPRLQRRIQRYGWDLAAPDYERLWHAQLASAQEQVLACASLAPGERVLDVACGTGLVSFAAARDVGHHGSLVGIDLSGEMVERARRKRDELEVSNANFARMDAEALTLNDADFDVALCALGLMYMPDPEQALREMRRVLKPGGRMVTAVWGEHEKCGWASAFEIVDDEVKSDVCPLFFHLGQSDALARACWTSGFVPVEQHRIEATLSYADADEAFSAVFAGGPVALAWSRFSDEVRARVNQRFVESIAPWREGRGYRMPAEFVVVEALVSESVPPPRRMVSNLIETVESLEQ